MLRSPIFLVVSVLFTINFICSIAAIFLGQMNYSQIIRLIQGIDFPGQVSGYISTVTTILSVLDSGALLANLALHIPSLLFCIGLWAVYAAARRAEGEMPGAGFGFLKATVIINMIVACVVMAIILILMVAVVIASWISGTIPIMVLSAVVLVVTITVVMMIIMYYFCYLATIKTCRLNSNGRRELRQGICICGSDPHHTCSEFYRESAVRYCQFGDRKYHRSDWKYGLDAPVRSMALPVQKQNGRVRGINGIYIKIRTAANAEDFSGWERSHCCLRQFSFCADGGSRSYICKRNVFGVLYSLTDKHQGRAGPEMPERRMNMTKVDIISGFLGAGKTTLIKKLIQDVFSGQKIVLIENEFGEIGIDGGFLKDAGINITEMNSGCICCSLVGDFGKALKEVTEKFSPDRIIIEPSGVGKLSDVRAAVENAARRRGDSF